MSSFRIHIIGVAEGRLDRQNIEVIESCVLIVASRSLLSLIQTLLPLYPQDRMTPIAPLDSALNAIDAHRDLGDIAVLASGDPLFYGIGELLIRRFTKEHIVVYPAVTSMQLLSARLLIPWHDVHVVSLHGRRYRSSCLAEILSFRKVCVLTDKEHSPSWIAAQLLHHLSDAERTAFTISVGERLGLENERIVTGSLSEIATLQFEEPNIVLILQDRAGNAKAPFYGLQEQEIGHSRGLITKDEVRAAVIHLLRLPAEGVLWDIGAGSGAISIESARLSRAVNIFAIEKNQKQLDHIAGNRERFQAWNVEIVEGQAPEILDTLPDPDRIFIGGSGGNLAAIADTSCNRLKDSGRIVISAVLEKTRNLAPEILRAAGMTVEERTISVTRRYWPDRHPITLNPITLIIGQKKSRV